MWVVAALNRVPLEQRLKGGEGVGQTVIWMKSVSARENSQCKGPIAGRYLVYSRNSKEANATEEKQNQGQKLGDKIREETD